MKKVFSFFALTALVLSVGFTSCSKEDTADPLTVDLTRTATVKGKVLINEDETKDEKKWSAPSTIQLVVTVPYNQLNSSAAGGNYVVDQSKITYTPSTGEFSIEVPVGVSSTTIDVKLSQFNGEVKRFTTGTDTKTFKVIWNSSTGRISATPGEIVYLPEWTKNGDYDIVKNPGDNI